MDMGREVAISYTISTDVAPWTAVNLDRCELDIGWQLQRVRRQLLHRETKTEASEATLRLPGICMTALRIREKDHAAAKAAAGASWVQRGG
jgi:hypothetical protein